MHAPVYMKIVLAFSCKVLLTVSLGRILSRVTESLNIDEPEVSQETDMLNDRGFTNFNARCEIVCSIHLSI